LPIRAPRVGISPSIHKRSRTRESSDTAQA
jgi:hypothetical protein